MSIQEEMVNQEPEENIEEAEVIEEPLTKEEKFLGIRTQVEIRKSEKEEDSDLSIEVIDDRLGDERKKPRSKAQKKSDQAEVEEEIDNVDDRVKKRINKLKYEFHEERRAKEAAERLRDESVNFSRQQQEENLRLRALVQRGEGALIAQVKAKAEAELDKAKNQHKEAYELGDSERLTDATEQMLSAQSELKVANDHFNRLEAQQKFAPPPNVQQQQQPPQQAYGMQNPPQVDPRAVSWLKDNPWFGADDEKEMTALAYGIHENLVTKEGISPTSEQYYEEVDKRMRKRFPDYFKVETTSSEDGDDENVEVETATPRNTQSVVAPATRNNGSRPRKVQLTATQVALAKRLGLSPERYARELIKEKM
jgi:hypothetical protein